VLRAYGLGVRLARRACIKSSTELQGALCGVGGTEQDEEDSVSSTSSGDEDDDKTQMVSRSLRWKGVHVCMCACVSNVGRVCIQGQHRQVQRLP
jgi:hypothetical protein